MILFKNYETKEELSRDEIKEWEVKIKSTSIVRTIRFELQSSARGAVSGGHMLSEEYDKDIRTNVGLEIENCKAAHGTGWMGIYSEILYSDIYRLELYASTSQSVGKAFSIYPKGGWTFHQNK